MYLQSRDRKSLKLQIELQCRVDPNGRRSETKETQNSHLKFSRYAPLQRTHPGTTKSTATLKIFLTCPTGTLKGMHGRKEEKEENRSMIGQELRTHTALPPMLCPTAINPGLTVGSCLGRCAAIGADPPAGVRGRRLSTNSIKSTG